jgi:predicted dehydrogenase
MNRLRTAVIGTGHLGRIHAKLAAESSAVELVAVVDVNAETRDRVAAEFKVPGVADYRQLVDTIEGAIIATPTVHHFKVASELLRAGVHVLVEKPITTTVAEAEELVKLADEAGLVLQVGHVERFNPGFECVADRFEGARFIQASRTSGFTFRSTDIGVVMDLMIHDIDIVLSIVPSPVIEVSAMGISVLSRREDVAQAQLRFANGCRAQLVASRVSYSPTRSMQVYTAGGYTHVDFAQRKATVVDPTPEVLSRQWGLEKLSPERIEHYREHLFEELLVKRELNPPATNAIAEEQRDFATSVREARQPRVTGRAGKQALEVAEQVLHAITRYPWDGTSSGRIGPMLIEGWESHHALPAYGQRKAG